jgi:recombinational DNA repair protein (RecF pathway)
MASVNDAEALPMVKLYFELWLLRLSGYLPDWGKCELCGKVLQSSATTYMVAGMHLRCGECRARNVIEEISPEAFDLFYRIQKEAPQAFVVTAEGKNESIKLISRVLQKLIAQALGREVASGNALR